MTVTSELGAASGVSDPATVRATRWGWIRETVIVIAFYYVYQGIRSIADHGVTTRAYRNARWLVSWEQHLFIYHEQAIQAAFLSSEWFIRVMNIYYGTLHFVITVGLLVWMYRKRHHAYLSLIHI